MFDLFKKEVHYSAEQIHAEMFLMINLYIKQLEEFKETKLYKPEIFEIQNKLNSVGLLNTKNSLILQDKINLIKNHNETVDYYTNTFLLLKYLFKFFGQNVMLIKFDDFEKLINKYNLVCGNMYQYTGTIPEKNINEIYNVQQKMNLIYNYSYFKSEYDGYSEKDKKMLAFLQQEIKSLSRITKIHKKYKKYKKEIFRFPFITKDMYIPAINEQILRGFIDIKSNESKLFIVAPIQEMKDTNIEFSTKIKTEDPFVCAYTKYGIIVFSKWGTEAEDEIIKKYENLFI